MTITTAPNFISADKTYLGSISNASLQAGDIDFEIGCWVKLTSLATDFVIANKWDWVGNADYLLRYNVGVGFRFNASGSGLLGGIVGLNYTITPTLNTWYFVRAWHDSVANTLNINVNEGATPQSVAHTSGMHTGSSPLYLGYWNNASADIWGSGSLAGLYIRKQISTPEEASRRYNAGRMRPYAYLPTADKVGLVSQWDLSESLIDGTHQAVDSHGTNHLSFYNFTMVANGNFETAGAGADPFSSWIEANLGTSSVSAETTTPYAGTKSCKLTTDASGSYVTITQALLAIGKRYSASLYARRTAGSGGINVGDGSSTTGQFWEVIPAATYTPYSGSFLAGYVNFSIKRSSGANLVIDIDDVTLLCLEVLATTGPDTIVYAHTPSGGLSIGGRVRWRQIDASRICSACRTYVESPDGGLSIGGSAVVTHETITGGVSIGGSALVNLSDCYDDYFAVYPLDDSYLDHTRWHLNGSSTHEPMPATGCGCGISSEFFGSESITLPVDRKKASEGFSVSVWVNPNSYGIQRAYYSRGNAFVFGHNIFGQLWVELETTGGRYEIHGTTALENDRWYLVCATWQPGVGVSLWVNGVLETSMVITDKIMIASSEAGIGRYLGASFPSCRMQELRVDSRILGAADLLCEVSSVCDPGFLTCGVIQEALFQ